MIYLLRKLLNVFSGGFSFLIYFLLAFELFFLNLDASYPLFYLIHKGLFLVIFFDSLLRLLIRPSTLFGYFRTFIGLLSFVGILHYYGFFPQFSFGFQQLLLIIIAISRFGHLSFLFSPLRLSLLKHLLAGLFFFILMGALLLTLPDASHGSMSYIDALYMSVSAICVTGLTVVDVGLDFTFLVRLFYYYLFRLEGWES